jgi:hypothetical protein
VALCDKEEADMDMIVKRIKLKVLVSNGRTSG